MTDNGAVLRILNEEIVGCRKCPRLVEYRERVAREKRLAYRDCTYWGKPVPGFGDPRAQLLLVGLAPGAHGSNRTGRMFTGDRSGVFLYQALYDAGFATQPNATRMDDGLRLKNTYIAAAARCAPPDNKPLPVEILNCRGYLEREIDILRPRAVLALGKIGWDVFMGILKHRGLIATGRGFPFAHAAEVELPKAGLRLFGVYHPSQQNTQTGLLTPAMYATVLRRIREFLEASGRRKTG
ncbi:MAG TPA: uracil-DNA glycosylase [Candidatus Acidoferrum sp.]|nr:uracil-DNA glycosylase [Candidatus Acidoferrum sp.]